MTRVKPRTLAYLLLLAVAALWGATFTLVKDALADCSPLLFNLLRMSLATLALLLVNRRRLRHLPRSTSIAGALVGLSLAAGYQFQTVGLALTTPTKSAFITGLVVVLVPCLTAIPPLRPAGTPAPGISAAVGAVLAFTGLFLLSTPPGTTLHTVLGTVSRGDLLTLLCAFSFSAHLLTLARTSSTIPASTLATLQIATATLVMAATLPLGGRPDLHVTPRLLVALAVTGLLATAAAFTVQSWAQQHLPPSHTALLLTLEPVFALLTSTLLLGERTSHRTLAGDALILAGIFSAELGPRPPSPIPA